MSTFRRLLISEFKSPPQIVEEKIPPLSEREILIKTHYSGINYKDALAVTSKGKILKSFPLSPGIDAAGEVIESNSNEFSSGDLAFVNGCNFGEILSGGFAEYVVVPEDRLMKLPNGITTKEAMTYGTAGFTAALCVERMQVNGQNPEKGSIVVTGASGGVGSFAVGILSQLGYEVVAVSGKETEHSRLKEYGAVKAIRPDQLELGGRPLEKSKFAGAVDNVGGELLSKILAHVDLYGNIASVGLAGGHELNSTVMPFILRGVSLLGISSNNCEMSLRRELWKKLGNEWKNNSVLSSVVSKEISLEQIPEFSNLLLGRKISGRIIVKF